MTCLFNASQAVSDLLGYEDSNIPMISYDREEGAASVVVSFTVDTDSQNYFDPATGRTYGSPSSDVWREEEELYVEFDKSNMRADSQTDSLSDGDSAALSTSMNPEPEGRTDVEMNGDRIADESPRCKYFTA